MKVKAPTINVLPLMKCSRCEHYWIPRKEEKPRRCPGCGSPYWDKPRGR